MKFKTQRIILGNDRLLTRMVITLEGEENSMRLVAGNDGDYLIQRNGNRIILNKNDLVEWYL
jgi:hypothetical protein